MQVPPADRGAFEGFLARLGYEYVDRNRQPGLRMFLGSHPGSSLPQGPSVSVTPGPPG